MGDGFRNYGTGVSENPQDVASGGDFSAAEKSFETFVTRADSPCIDWEMNLRQEIQGYHGNGLTVRRSAPSHFRDGDFLERPDLSGSYVFLSAVVGNANKFQLRAQNVSVNGWNVRVDYSSIATPGLNEITLTAPPVAGTRTDLVILEVWRAVLLPTPSVANKSPTGLVLRHGNVKAPDAVNFIDDLVDPVYGLPSSNRVQVQYRLRVVSNVDISTYPDGLDDPSVVARTVSDFTGPGADGNATAFTYSSMADDKGLWRAGTGDPAGAAALGTADGYMYAIPVCAVIRRNTTAFDRSANMNGGSSIASGTPTRPDGLYADQIVAADVLDLRKGASTSFQEILEKAVQQVLDNTMSTRSELTSQGTGGTSPMFREDIGVSGRMGNPDGVRRYFSDRSVTETIVAESVVGGLPVSTVTFRLDQLKLPWNAGTVNLKSLAASGTNLVDVFKVRLRTATTDTDMLDPLSPVRVVSMTFGVAVGPEIDQVVLVFNTTTSNSSVYAELAIEYPNALGASRNMVQGIQVWSPAAGLPAWVDSSGYVATSDANRLSVPASPHWWADPGHRELALRLLTTTQSVAFRTYAQDRIMIWERLTGDPITIDDGVNAPYATTNYTFNTSYTVVALTGAVPIPAGTSVDVDYEAFRAAPPVAVAPNDSYQLFYQTRSVQTIPPPAGSVTLQLVPRAFYRSIMAVGAGSGSPDDAFPYVAPSSQLPVGSLPAATYPESRLDAPSDIGIVGFGVNTGYLELGVLVPYGPNPSEVTLYKSAPDVVTDADGRHFWPKSDPGTPPKYSPVVFGPQIASGRRHKAAYPVLMELKEDFASIGKKGTLVLVFFTRWFEFNPEVSIVLTATASDSAAGVFRVRGCMMNSRRPDY